MRTSPSRWWSPQSTCFVLLWVGLLCCAPAHMLGDPGSLWHTVVGRRILEGGALIRTDPFSFTCQGQPWIAQQWLGEIAMALIDRLAGLDGLVLATATILAVTYTGLFRRFMHADLPWLVCVILVLLVIAASSYHFLPRPHVFTIAMTAWMFGLLNDVDAGRRRPQWLLSLPPLYIVWTNVHGGALGGIATSTCILLVWLCLPTDHPAPGAETPHGLLRRAWDGTLPTSPAGLSPRILGAAASLSFLAVLVNPYGPGLPAVWISLMRSPVLPKLIVEHAPLQVLSLEGVVILALAAAYLMLLITSWRQARRVTWLMPLAWLALAFTRIRHGPLFAVTAAVAMADMLPYCPLLARLRVAEPRSGLLPSTVRADLRVTTGRPFIERLRPALIPASLVLVALLLQAGRVGLPVLGSGWSCWSADRWPVEAVEALRRQSRPDHRALKVFNDLAFGGYLIHALPEARIYIDDRCELYRDDGLLQYNDFATHPERVDAFAMYEGVDVALTKRGSSFDRHFAASPAWKLLHSDRTAAVYARVPPLAARVP